MLGLASLLVTGTAPAAEPVLPLGTDGKGAHLDVRRGGPLYRGRPVLVLTFDASAADQYRQIAGRDLEVTCVRFGRPPRLFGASGGSGQQAPRRQRPIVVMINRRYDLCSIGVRHGHQMRVLARIPLTAFGAQRLDEHNTAVAVVAAVRTLARPERPSAATVAATFHGVVLTAPTDMPPPGVLGVYSDGAEHVYAAEIDRAGKLLFVEQEGDVTRSNLIYDLLDEDSLGID